MSSQTEALTFHEVAKLSDIPAGSITPVQVGELRVALFNVDGVLYATEEICTHAQASLAEGYLCGDQIECPLHGACFSVKTGKALTAPATIDLATYPVRVEQGNVLLGIPAQGHTTS